MLIFLVIPLEPDFPDSKCWVAGGSYSGLLHDKRQKEDFMKFRPLHDRILVKRVESEEKTKGGIIIPDTRKRNRRRAR